MMGFVEPQFRPSAGIDPANEREIRPTAKGWQLYQNHLRLVEDGRRMRLPIIITSNVGAHIVDLGIVIFPSEAVELLYVNFLILLT